MADCRVIKVIADSGAYEPNRSPGGIKAGDVDEWGDCSVVGDAIEVGKIHYVGVEGFDKRVLPYDILGLT